jgi:hypothetical protein
MGLRVLGFSFSFKTAISFLGSAPINFARYCFLSSLKEITNEYGLWKLTKEINFYNFIINNNIKLKIPKIYEIGINFIKMEYMKDYLPIVDIISKFNVSNLDIILSKIYIELNILHNSKSLIILKEEYYDNLYYETHTKIELRFKHINHIYK